MDYSTAAIVSALVMLLIGFSWACINIVMKGKKQWKQIFALLALLVMLPMNGLGEDLEEEGPCLDLNVAYGLANRDGDISATVILSLNPGTGSDKVNNAHNVDVILTGENGITVASPASYHFDRTDGSAFGVFLHYSDPEGGMDINEPPTFRIMVTSEDCGSLEYNCVFDVQPEPRALILCRTDGDYGDIFRNTAGKMDNALRNGTYYGRAIQGDTLFENKDLWSAEEGLGQLETMGIDDNDLTFIYIVSHGSSDGKIEWKKENGEYTFMSEVLDAIANHVKGRVVIILDSCFSGQIVKYAEEINLDTERFFVASSTGKNFMGSNTGNVTELGNMLGKLYQGRSESALCSDLEAEMRSLDVFRQLITSDLPAESVTRITAHASLFKSGALALATSGTSLFIENEIQAQLDEQISLLKDDPQDSVYKRGLIHLEKTWLEASAHPFNTLKTPMKIFWPQSYGKGELPLFANGMDFDDGYRLLVAEQETLDRFGSCRIGSVIATRESYYVGGEGSHYKIILYPVDEEGYLILDANGDPVCCYEDTMDNAYGFSLRVWLLDHETIVVEWVDTNSTNINSTSYDYCVYRLDEQNQLQVIRRVKQSFNRDDWKSYTSFYIGEECVQTFDSLESAEEALREFFVPCGMGFNEWKDITGRYRTVRILRLAPVEEVQAKLLLDVYEAEYIYDEEVDAHNWWYTIPDSDDVVETLSPPMDARE